MRRRALVAILVCLAGSAFAAAPVEDYWRARLEAMARLAALAKENADPAVIREVESAALEALRRELVEIVGPVKVAGFSSAPKNHVTALAESSGFGRLDGVEFAADKAGGSLVVTTGPLLRLWLSLKGGPAPAKTDGAVLNGDKVYGDALNPHDGFSGVADIALPKPEGVSFAAAKLGRWGLHSEAAAGPVLIVTIVKGKRVFIFNEVPTTRLLDIPACAASPAAVPDAWGPSGDGEAFEAWRSCVRRRLPEAPYFVQLKREAREIGERLARAK